VEPLYFRGGFEVPEVCFMRRPPHKKPTTREFGSGGLVVSKFARSSSTSGTFLMSSCSGQGLGQPSPDLSRPASKVPICLPDGVFVIGLLGGIGSGKSTVAAEFGKLGAGTLDADLAARKALEDPAIRQEIEQKWGDRVKNQVGRLDRRKLAQIVFAPDPAAAKDRKFLEELVHPKVAQILEAWAKELVSSGKKVLVLDVPLLAEVGWHENCHLLIFIDTPQPQRWSRLRERGWSWAEFLQREAAQLSLEKKRALAHAVLVNTGSKEDLPREVRGIWQRWVEPWLRFH